MRDSASGGLNIGTAALIEKIRKGVASPRVLIISAHPDDETAGAGSLFRYLIDPYFMHTTDGSPRDLKDARAAGYGTRDEYARARRAEFSEVLRLAGLPPQYSLEAGFIDQEASSNLYELTLKIAVLIREIKPDLVMTHPYEGGHPDHDATSFGVHGACAIIGRENGRVPLIIEFTSYHADGSKMVSAEFLPSPSDEEAVTVNLEQEDRLFKQSLMDAFLTQKKVLSQFPIELERYRKAPLYDFTAPPHAGRLFYEFFDWSITGADWRVSAKKALIRLRL
ncbi:MAG: PIG-L family deacetylase [Deltaproteobacteria bacterium]|nr:PIG-L family deacetylase [Deltaproteobacteria bacterium]